MKNFVSIFLFLLLSIANLFGQAQVDFQLIIHDNALGRDTLNFGLDLTATDGIDPQLNEFDLPPPPPGNAFDVRWWLPPFAGSLASWRDYRAPGNPPSFPFNGNKQHVVKFQSTDYPITFSWSLPSTIASSSTIKDPFGGVIVNASFSGIDSVVVSNAAITQLNISIDYTDIVPVELVSFTGEYSNSAILLRWITASELNNQGFQIEKKYSINGWQSIGFIHGFGTTSETKMYEFKDSNIADGINSYRLKQIDYDGSFSYSDEIEVFVDMVPQDFVLYQNFPNPFNPTTTISFSLPEKSFVRLSVYNLIGEKVSDVVNKTLDKGTYSYDWKADGYKSGVYFYELRTDNFSSIKKMQLIK